jgi:hypothetical protein
MDRLALRTLLIVGAIATSNAVAKDEKVSLDLHYTCLNSAVAGLEWHSSRWTPTRYNSLGQFQLEIKITDDDATADEPKHQTIHFLRNGDSGNDRCAAEYHPGMFDTLLVCTDAAIASTYIFSQSVERGSMSHLLGAIGTEDRRDSLVVMPFTCQKS